MCLCASVLLSWCPGRQNVAPPTLICLTTHHFVFFLPPLPNYSALACRNSLTDTHLAPPRRQRFSALAANWRLLTRRTTVDNLFCPDCVPRGVNHVELTKCIAAILKKKEGGVGLKNVKHSRFYVIIQWQFRQFSDMRSFNPPVQIAPVQATTWSNENK